MASREQIMFVGLGPARVHVVVGQRVSKSPLVSTDGSTARTRQNVVKRPVPRTKFAACFCMSGQSDSEQDEETQRRNRLAIEQEFNLNISASTDSNSKASSAAATLDSGAKSSKEQDNDSTKTSRDSDAERGKDSLDEVMRKALRERMDLQTTTERQWAEICAMFVSLEGMTGLELMDRKTGNPSFRAWVFVLLWWILPVALVYYLYKFSSGIHF